MNEIITFLFADDQIVTTSMLLVLIALLIGNIITDIFRKYEIIDIKAAIDLMDDKDNLILLDVREKKERSDGYLEGDKHIPLSSVKDQLGSLDKNKKVLVYCRTGSRSGHIAGLLTRNGFEKVYNLKGGINAWKRAKLPFKT